MTFTAVEGYSLPNNISVIGATYTWDKSTGKLILSKANNLVTISITGEKVWAVNEYSNRFNTTLFKQ